MQHGHERKYHGCYIRFKRSSLRLSSQRGTEAGGRGTEALLLKKAVKKKKFNNSSFPVVLRHVVNYASGHCIVGVFYSSSRGEVENLFHF